MKTIVFLITLLLGWTQLQARDNRNMVDEYSPERDIYYKGIGELVEDGNSSSKKSAKRGIKNIQVFDLKTGDSWKVFFRDFGPNFTIRDLVVERPLVKDDLYELQRDKGVLKNRGKKVKANDRILIIVRDIAEERDILWRANKKGKELKAIAIVGVGESWHIDVGNKKIRVFTRKADKYGMKEYDW